MSDASSPIPPVLTCWKDIAQYFGKGVRTVQRWERDLGLPVRRPLGIDHKTAVVAYPRDLDAWLQSRWSRRPIEPTREPKQMAQIQAAVDQKLSSEISDGLRRSCELQKELRALRKQHRDLVDQLSSGVHALSRTCRQYPWQSSSSSSRLG